MSGGRPRSGEVDQRIRAAAADLLAECGYREFSMEEVARRARVGKQSVYRRWPGRAFLLFEVTVGAMDSVAGVLPDTGSLHEDLTAIARRQAEGLTRPEVIETLRGILADALTDPTLRQQFIDHVATPRLAGLALVAQRARDRGELADDIDPALVGQILGSATIMHYLFLGGTDAGFAQAAARVIAKGATAAKSATREY